jgi:monoamine oxidase
MDSKYNILEKVDVIIIGAGISGLHTGFKLASQGLSIKVFEAKEQVGGRIFSPSFDGSVSGFDIGPSWFWPGQSNIEGLVTELGLQDQVFTQYADGQEVYEPVHGTVRKGSFGISMQGAYRMKGGLATITESLKQHIDRLTDGSAIQTNAAVKRIKLESEQKLIEVAYDDVEGNEIINYSDKVVIAMPPRVAINNIKFTPSLSAQRTQEFGEVATWMAGHAKAVAVYDTPFWRNADLSGDAFSQRGPLSEIHDASPFDQKFTEAPNAKQHYALFGFFSTSPQNREDDIDKITAQIVDQLSRLFGDQASKPVQVLYKDWARDPLVATAKDQLIPNHHPMNSISSIVELDWQQKSELTSLIWSGTETAQGHYNGYIEGAIISSHAALAKLNT